MAHGSPGQDAQLTPSADLALLVATERDLEAALDTAREQARLTVEAAYTQAAAAARAQEEELLRARAEFVSSIEEEKARRTSEVLAEGQQRAVWFDAMPAGRIEELGRLVVARLLQPEPR